MSSSISVKTEIEGRGAGLKWFSGRNIDPWLTLSHHFLKQEIHHWRHRHELKKGVVPVLQSEGLQSGRVRLRFKKVAELAMSAKYTWELCTGKQYSCEIQTQQQTAASSLIYCTKIKVEKEVLSILEATSRGVKDTNYQPYLSKYESCTYVI